MRIKNVNLHKTICNINKVDNDSILEMGHVWEQFKEIFLTKGRHYMTEDYVTQKKFCVKK